jgi:hypothetical protein
MDPEGGCFRVSFHIWERVPGGSELRLVWGLRLVCRVCSIWRVLLFTRPLQPVGLFVEDGRALPQRCLGVESSAMCVCYGRLPSHISWRRVRSLCLVATGCPRMADEAQKSSRYIRPRLVVTRRVGGQGVGCVRRCPDLVGCVFLGYLET